MENIDYYIRQIKEKKLDGGERRTKAYPFIEDSIILVEKAEDDFLTLKERIKKCKELGINIPEYYEYKLDKETEHYYIMEELALGDNLESLLNDESNQNITAEIPYNHIEKYIRDSYLLEQNGIGAEPRRRNIFYDKESGFTIIDVAAFSDNERKLNSLESVAYFFEMYSNILLANFSNDERGQKSREIVILNMIKAFENGHPYFKKYSRFILRGNEYYANILSKLGYDFTLSKEEEEELEYYINQLIEEIVDLKINNKEGIFNTSKYGYIRLLSNSLKYSSNFILIDKSKIKLESYIEKRVFSEIKEKYLSNPENENLKRLYYQIRKKELDPVNIYPEEYLENIIKKELDELISTIRKS